MTEEISTGRILKHRYLLEERLGSGPWGDVYKALDLQQKEAGEKNPHVAIKLLRKDLVSHEEAIVSLQREMERTRQIHSKHIIAMYEFNEDGETVYAVMEFLRGETLNDFLKHHPEGVSLEDARNIVRDICDGLKAAHALNIVHSDFRPDNVFYTEDKVAKVLDFGVARVVPAVEDELDKKDIDAGWTGALAPAYASYEILTGQPPSRSDDVYAVALVAYELLTGKHPYNREPAEQALDRGLEPEPIPFLKQHQWNALRKALEFKAEDRTATIEEFTEGLL